jgi:hypothetical protein
VRYADDLKSSSVLLDFRSGPSDRWPYRQAYHNPTKAAMPFVPSYLLEGLPHSVGWNQAATCVTYFALIALKSFPESTKDDSRLFAKTFGETSFPMWWVASSRRMWPCCQPSISHP